MQKFTDFVKDHKTVVLESLNRTNKENAFNSLVESKLKEFGANSVLDLSEEELEKFNSYVKSIKESKFKYYNITFFDFIPSIYKL